MSKGYKTLHFLLAWIFRAVYRIKIVSPENEPDPGKAYILCANHLSALDPILLCASLKKIQPRYMAKDSLFKIPLLSALIRAFGAYPVNRSGSALSAIKKSVELLKTNLCIGIFPQGHRHPGKLPRETEIKNGIGQIVYRSHTTVLPVCIQTKGWKIGFFKRTYVRVGKPMTFEDFGFTEGNHTEYDRAAHMVFEKITDMIE